jgi:SagB-type dehydrogenase family enzyme
VIDARKTERDFSGKPISYHDLEIIVSATFARNRTEEGQYLHRSPSAGGLFGIKGYIIAPNVDGLPKGIYSIDSENNCITRIEDDCPKLADILMSPEDQLNNTSAAIVICANMNLLLKKYGPRSFRFAFLDAGHAMQNIFLAATALQLKMVPLGGFSEIEIAEALQIDDEMIQPVYACVVGK